MSATMVATQNVVQYIIPRVRTGTKELEYLVMNYNRDRGVDYMGNKIFEQTHHMSNLDADYVLGFAHGRERIDAEEPITQTTDRAFKDRTGGLTLESPWESIWWEASGSEEEPVRWMMVYVKNLQGVPTSPLNADGTPVHSYYQWHTRAELEAMRDSGVLLTDGTVMCMTNVLQKLEANFWEEHGEG